MPSRPAVLRLALVSYLPAALLAGAPARAAEPAAPAASRATSARTWTVDDILLEEAARDFRVAPDGRTVVWVKTAMDAKKGARVANLFLSRLDGAPDETALTRGKDRNTHPRFSPDGRTIAFLSNRVRPDDGGEEGEKAADEEDDKTQIWLVRAAGGEPWPLTKLDREIADFGWKDAETLVVAAAEEKSLDERKRKEAKDTSEPIEDAEATPPVRLFAVSAKDGALTRLTDGRDWIEWVELSPDGRYAAALHAQSLSFQYDHRTLPVLKVHDLAAGTARTVFEGKRVLPTGVAWAPDSKGFYVTHSYSSHPTYFTATIELLQYVDAASGAAAPVDLQWKNGLGTKAVLPTADGFLALLADGIVHRPARYVRAGGGFARQDLAGAHVPHVFDWAIGRDGATVVYDHSTATKPPQLHRARLEGARLADEAVLTTLNPGHAKKPVHRMEVLRWKGARDEEVTGLLYYPLGWKEGTKHPLFLSIHGGPAGGADMDVWSQGWDYPKLLLAQKGAFLLEVNHGSSNFGLDWVESICCGNYYDLERVDLEKGVDTVIARGLADPDRLATMGWSNGSILTTELVTRSRRYKVASAGAGDVEWISDWGNVDFGASFDNYYLGKAPYEDPELYVRKSPYFRLKDVTTPMIVYTGTEDRNVPPSQSWSHFRVMQQVGQGARPLRHLPRRAARPAEVRPPEAQGRGGPRVVRPLPLRHAGRGRGGEGRLAAREGARAEGLRAGRHGLRPHREGPPRAGDGRARGPAPVALRGDAGAVRGLRPGVPVRPGHGQLAGERDPLREGGGLRGVARSRDRRAVAAAEGGRGEGALRRARGRREHARRLGRLPAEPGGRGQPAREGEGARGRGAAPRGGRAPRGSRRERRPARRRRQRGRVGDGRGRPGRAPRRERRRPGEEPGPRRGGRRRLPRHPAGRRELKARQGGAARPATRPGSGSGRAASPPGLST
ncbi:MAG: prolyl oligopeptidase family serine peptidase [Vicinamibacteria bacterium]